MQKRRAKSCTPVPVVTFGTTRTGVVRTNAADWRALRDNWDDLWKRGRIYLNGLS